MLSSRRMGHPVLSPSLGEERGLRGTSCCCSQCPQARLGKGHHGNRRIRLSTASSPEMEGGHRAVRVHAGEEGTLRIHCPIFTGREQPPGCPFSHCSPTWGLLP